MTGRELTMYYCDFCQYFNAQSLSSRTSSTETPQITRWFEVDNPSNKMRGWDGHACVECGHKLHLLLSRFGFNHTFVSTQYADSPGMGEIVILEGIADGLD